MDQESLPYHLKSDVHVHSVCAQQNRDSIQRIREQSMQEERAIEEQMDFAMLSSAIELAVMMKTCISVFPDWVWKNKKCGITVHFPMRSSMQELTIQLLQLKNRSAWSKRSLILTSGAVLISSPKKTQMTVNYCSMNWHRGLVTIRIEDSKSTLQHANNDS